MARPRTTARDQLLAATMAYVAAHGVADLSLRKLAAEIGTSHRMLIFHFGSKEGLLAAVVSQVEATQRQALADLVEDADLPVEHQMEQLWARFSDPALAAQEKLFFEVFAQALQGRSFAAGLFAEVIGAWLPPLAQLNRRMGADETEARHAARIQLALTRGILMDLLATGERDEIEQALRHFQARYHPAIAHHKA